MFLTCLVESEEHFEDGSFDAEPEAEVTEEEIDDVHYHWPHPNKCSCNFKSQVTLIDLLLAVFCPHEHANYRENVADYTSKEIDRHLD